MNYFETYLGEQIERYNITYRYMRIALFFKILFWATLVQHFIYHHQPEIAVR